MNPIDRPLILLLRDVHQFYSENRDAIFSSNHKDKIVFLMDLTNELYYNYKEKDLEVSNSTLKVSINKHKNIAFCSIDGTDIVELSEIISALNKHFNIQKEFVWVGFRKYEDNQKEFIKIIL